MRRLLGVLALVALALIAVALIAGPPAVVAAHAAQAVQDTAQDTAQDTLAAQEEAPPLAPLPQLVADLAEIAAKIDEVETNLAEAPPESQAVFAFQRRRRWQEHHDVLGRLVEGMGKCGAT